MDGDQFFALLSKEFMIIQSDTVKQSPKPIRWMITTDFINKLKTFTHNNLSGWERFVSYYATPFVLTDKDTHLNHVAEVIGREKTV